MFQLNDGTEAARGSAPHHLLDIQVNLDFAALDSGYQSVPISARGVFPHGRLTIGMCLGPSGRHGGQCVALQTS